MEFRLDHLLQAPEGELRYAQDFAHVKQQALFRPVHSAVRVRRLQLDLDEHLDQRIPPVALLAELLENLVERKVFGLSLVEKPDRRRAHLGVEVHSRHDVFRQGNLVPGDMTVRLGDLAHDREGRSEEGRLYPLPLPGGQFGLGVEPLHPLVQVVAEDRAEKGSQGSAQDEAEGTTDHFSPPAQDVALRVTCRRCTACR